MSLCPPVIVVPGITATSLRDEYPVDPERVWTLPDAASGVLATWRKHFERIALHPDDLRFELVEPSRVVADALFGMPYGELIAELRHNLAARADEPVPVFPMAYDWRQPLDQAADRLAALIDEVVARTRLLPHYHRAGFGGSAFPAQVHLVGHSMGGMVIADYVARHGPARIGKIATLGSPFRGSHEAVLKVATGLAALGPSGASSREREAARLTPALYHLLPAYPGAVHAHPGLSGNLFEPAAWQPGVVATLAESVRLHGLDRSDPARSARLLLAKLLAHARQHRERLESLRLANSRDWLAIVGVGNRTRVRLHIVDREGQPFFDLAGADRENAWESRGERSVHTGDGTVPYLGARCAFVPTPEVVCLCPEDLGYWEVEDRVLQAASGLHPLLPKINLGQRLIVSHFLGRHAGEIWGRRAPDLPPDQPWTPPIAGLREKDPPALQTHRRSRRRK